MTPDRFPKLYAIIDAYFFRECPDPTAAIIAFAQELVAGGATLIQYRNKQGSPREVLSQARELRRVCSPAIRFIMNDRADLCLAAGFDGVHVGQEDLSPGAARAIVGERRWVGVSTHTTGQVMEADRTVLDPALAPGGSGTNGAPTVSVDYIAIGPVFATATKSNPDPVVALEGVRAARALTRRPLVAIGGITRENCRAVRDAGADAVAVIADLLKEPSKAVEEFLRLL